MTTMTMTRRVFQALTLAGLAATAAVPARAAVIQSTPTEAVFGSELRFVPESRREYLFDASLGTLNDVTLAFDGTMTVNLSTTTDLEPPFPTTATAAVGVRYGRTIAALGSIAVPLTFTERPGDTYFPYSVRGSASEARSFEVSIPASSYGTYGSFNTDFRFTDLRPGSYSIVTDAIFRGTVTALFDYTPAGDVVLADATNVPEPASLAVLGLGVAGLIAVRRRAT